MPIRTGITDELEFKEVFNIIENFDPISSQFYMAIHIIRSTEDGDVFLKITRIKWMIGKKMISTGVTVGKKQS